MQQKNSDDMDEEVKSGKDKPPRRGKGKCASAEKMPASEKKKKSSGKGCPEKDQNENDKGGPPMGVIMHILRNILGDTPGAQVEIRGFQLPIPPELRKKMQESRKKSANTDDVESEVGEAPRDKRHSKQTGGGDPFLKLRQFRKTPREIRDYLNRFVVSQEQAKRLLSVAVCDHYNHIRELLEKPELNRHVQAKQNVILIGPTGCGKTYLMRCLADMLGVPFIKADATKYSETGYVGYDVEDMVRDLIKAANGNVNLAQYGIIYIDEIDKIAGMGGERKDVSGRGVQINLLKILEDAEVKVLSQMEMNSPMRVMMHQNGPETIHTKNILFIVSGAFPQLPGIIRKRLGHSQIGFGKKENTLLELSDEEILRDVRTEDLVEFGFEPEFVGRFPARAALAPLGIAELEQVLCSVENAFLTQYAESFRHYGINLKIQPDGVRAIAELAAKEHTGARGLLTVLEKLFRDFKFELPGTGCHELLVTAETVRDSAAALQKILRQQVSSNRIF